MTNEPVHDASTSNILAWTSQGAHMQHSQDDEAAADADEPPDPNQFKRSVVRKNAEPHQSLLTKALQEPDEPPFNLHMRNFSARRRSMNSNMSVASTADLTSDTGLTSPTTRSNTPSPPPPVITLVHAPPEVVKPKPTSAENLPPTSSDTSKPQDVKPETPLKKRCISFACGPKPQVKTREPPQPPVVEKAPIAEEKPQRKPFIKFACPAKPVAKPAAESAPSREQDTTPTAPRPISSPLKESDGSPTSVRKYRSPSSSRGRSTHLAAPRPSSRGPSSAPAKKYLTANNLDLDREYSRFHEFASDEPHQDEWIRLNHSATSGRLTINDTLQKENVIRKLGKEAEEEEEAEEDEEEEEEEEDQEDEDNADEDDDEATIHNNNDEDDIEDDIDDTLDIEDDLSGYGSDADFSDGYKTDEEVGFADSDDDDDAGDMQLWTPGNGAIAVPVHTESPINRRSSLANTLAGNRSDSSISDLAVSEGQKSGGRRRRMKVKPGTPELPDSTDFVCGTLDEDRALEDAYISCIAAKRREKLHVIPQDIDPSFPTSEPEDEDEEGKPRQDAQESDNNEWIHGELEDLHHEKARDRRNKKGGRVSPKRYRSPPPKRHASPAPKQRARSPRRLFDRQSPRRFASPAPAPRTRSPPGSLIQNNPRPRFNAALAFHPGLTHTKSLPRAPAMFPTHFKTQRRGKATNALVPGHVRGAIDIVKGLEKKRQRRKEKFREKNYQKHCDRARKGQIPDKRPQPGKGAERMREVGLAGKAGQGKFVLSC